MKKNYRYHLLKYKGRSSRLTCPRCGPPHCFTPYVDENDVPVYVERYGRCDHEQSCGYNLCPPYEPNLPFISANWILNLSFPMLQILMGSSMYSGCWDRKSASIASRA